MISKACEMDLRVTEAKGETKKEILCHSEGWNEILYT